MIKYTQIAIYFFIVINGMIWTAVSMHHAWSILAPQPPDEGWLSNGAGYVEWSDGRQEYLHKDNRNKIEMRPSDEG